MLPDPAISIAISSYRNVSKMLQVKQFAAGVPVVVFLSLRSKLKQLYSEGVERGEGMF